MKSRHLLITFLFTLGFGLCGCHGEHKPPAPLGERAALEKLAGTYETLMEKLPVSPAGLTPQGKLKFVQQVFKQAGYDFDATLLALAQTPPDNLSAYHKDMMELVLLPNQGLSEQAMEELYSATQWSSIKTIESFSR